MKKLLALVLVFSLLLGFYIDTRAYSIEPTEYTDVNNEAIKSTLEVLSAYGIISGYPDGSFRPDKYVTRAELAKICVELIRFGELTKDLKSNFKDMDGHWAERYVDLLADMGILNGYEDGTFKPDKEVSYIEAMAVMIRVLGYRNLDEYKDLKTCEDKARQLNLYDNLYMYTNNVTRGGLVTIISNALKAKPVTVKNGNLIEDEYNKTFFDTLGKKSREKITVDFALKHSDVDLSEYLLNTADVYFNRSGKIVLVTNLKYKTIFGTINLLNNNNIIEIQNLNGVTYRYNIDIEDVVLNMKKQNFNIGVLYKSEAMILFDNNETVKGIVAWKSTDAKVIKASQSYKSGAKTFMGKTLPADAYGKIDFTRINVSGAVDNLYDIKENDLVYFYENGNSTTNGYFKVDVVRNFVSGKITDIQYDRIFYIDDKGYEISRYFSVGEDISKNDFVVAMLDKDNNVAKFIVEKYGKEPETYAIVRKVNQDIDKLPVVSIVSENGRSYEYVLNSNSGLVDKTYNEEKVVYTTSINVGNIIKYDKGDENTIKIAKLQDEVNIKSIYDSATKRLTNGNYLISNSTIVVDYTTGTMKVSNINGLKDYIEGRACVNAIGIVEYLVLNKNVEIVEPEEDVEDKVEDAQVEKPPVVEPAVVKKTGTVVDMIKNVSANNGTVVVTFFNEDKSYNVANGIDISNVRYRNKLLKVEIVEDIVTSVKEYSPEIKSCKITAVYENQYQIDGLTYVECEKNLLVYRCETDGSGNVIRLVKATAADVKSGVTVDFYSTDGGYSGVMNVVVIVQ